MHHFRLFAPAALAALILLTGADRAAAQSVAVTPLVGAYLPAGDFDALSEELREFDTERERGLAYGLNLDVGFLRGTVRYVSDAVVSGEGVDDAGSAAPGFDSGNLLAASVDVVLRPIPRLLGVQPYVLGGVGMKRYDYDYQRDGADAFPSSESDTGLHVGVGADIVLGGLGLVVEIDDSITRLGEDLGRHDAFAMVGVRLSF